MAVKSHWVSEVFPVKFSLQDLLGDKEDNQGLERFNLKLKDHYQDVCNRVIASMDRPSTKISLEPSEVTGDKYQGNSREVGIKSTDQEDKEIVHSNITDASSTAVHASNCIWTKEELEIFRDGFFHLKERSVNLLLLLSNSKEQIKELRKKCRKNKAVISTQCSKLSEQKKQNMKLNATIRELRTDMEFSEQKIQQMSKIEAQLRDQNRFLISELEDERKELAKTRELCKKLDTTLKRQQKEITLGYMQQENVLKTRHMHNVEKIEKECKQLREELEKERNDHQLTQTALAQLRKHFANMQATTSSKGFLDVANIDYLVQCRD